MINVSQPTLNISVDPNPIPYKVTLKTRVNKDGSLGGNVYYVPNGHTYQQLDYIFFPSGQREPNDEQLNTILDRLLRHEAAALAFRKIGDAIIYFANAVLDGEESCADIAKSIAQ